MDFKEQVKNILESNSFEWNKYISSRIPDNKPAQPKENISSFIEEIDDLISKARKSGVDELTGLILAKKIYLKYNK